MISVVQWKELHVYVALEGGSSNLSAVMCSFLMITRFCKFAIEGFLQLRVSTNLNMRTILSWIHAAQKIARYVCSTFAAERLRTIIPWAYSILQEET